MNLNIRLDETHTEWLDEITKHYQKVFPTMQFSRSDIIRIAIRTLLAEVREQQAKESK
jgi:Arc/MetJ-type ribon-helix-helix transcriptional regulator